MSETRDPVIGRDLGVRFLCGCVVTFFGASYHRSSRLEACQRGIPCVWCGINGFDPIRLGC